jgi:hypothetical protein
MELNFSPWMTKTNNRLKQAAEARFSKDLERGYGRSVGEFGIIVPKWSEPSKSLPPASNSSGMQRQAPRYVCSPLPKKWESPGKIMVVKAAGKVEREWASNSIYVDKSIERGDLWPKEPSKTPKDPPNQISVRQQFLELRKSKLL